jgi:Zn-dependent alcohol dehydrogenase
VSQRSRAVVARELGLPVSVEQIEVQSPRHGEVMIRLAACGVCHSDLSATNGTIAYPLPLVLGHEGAGIVTAVGEGVSRYAIGDHVVSSFVSICGRCHYCQTGRPHLCVQSLQALYTLPDGSVRTFDAAGSPLNVFCGCGVMADYATLHADNLVKIDQQMPLDRAALIACGVMTGFGAAVNTARVEAGSVAVVFGCGGVGLNAIQGCAIAGAAMIVAVDTSAPKLELAERFGATHRFNVTGQDQIGKSLVQAHGRWCRLCLRLRGARSDFRAGLRCLTPRRDSRDRWYCRARRQDRSECATRRDHRKNADRQLLWFGATAA